MYGTIEMFGIIGTTATLTYKDEAVSSLPFVV
jgi:hypothetical protein